MCVDASMVSERYKTSSPPTHIDAEAKHFSKKQCGFRRFAGHGFTIVYPQIRQAKPPKKSPAGRHSSSDRLSRLSEVLWSYKRRTRRCKRCCAPIKLADLRIDASLKARQGVHHITGGEPCDMLLLPHQRSIRKVVMLM